jgi:KDO2-lipid IV(A) lauroyltransferase
MVSTAEDAEPDSGQPKRGQFAAARTHRLLWRGRIVPRLGITATYPARGSDRRLPIRLLTDRARAWVRPPWLGRSLLFLRQLCGLLAEAPTRRLLWRYCVTDVGVGLVSYGLYFGLRLLPLDTCSAIGGGLGLMVGRWRGIGRPNAGPRQTFLRLRPDNTGKADVDAAMNRMCANIGRVYSEYCILDLLWAAGRITVSGQEQLAACRNRGRPIIVFGVHLSSWEVIGAALLGLGYGVCTLHKPRKNRFQDRIANAVRLRGGAELVPPGPRGARHAYRALTDRRCLFLTWVDEAINGSIRAPAFGRPMCCHGNLAGMIRLARATGAQLIPAFVERQRGARFHTTFGPPIELIRAEDEKTALVANLLRLDQLISSIILPRLEYWRMLPTFRFDR